MSKWKDKKNYKINEIECSEIKLGEFKVFVHRHIHYPNDVWLASCYGLFEKKELASKKLSEAKCQAKAKLQSILEIAIDDILDV